MVVGGCLTANDKIPPSQGIGASFVLCPEMTNFWLPSPVQ